MVQIAYIILAHKEPSNVIAQAHHLSAAGDCVVIHYDKRAPAQEYTQICEALRDTSCIALVKKRVRCGWGEWSLVEATLRALNVAISTFHKASYFYLISGDCMPIKPVQYIRDFLAQEDVDHIESSGFNEVGRIDDGLGEKRFIYRHFFNERRHKALFYRSMALQEKLGLERALPEDFSIFTGSQWWCLRRSTVVGLLSFYQCNAGIKQFFRWSWIPDETFFQTLVRHLVPQEQICSRSPTFSCFTPYGVPAPYYNDHYDFLVSQPHLFARKVSLDAKTLKHKLGELYQKEDHVSQQKEGCLEQGKALFDFLTRQGAMGCRFGLRFWQQYPTSRKERRLMIILSEKGVISQRLVNEISKTINVPVFHEIFSSDTVSLPDLGGLETTYEKRRRHPMAILNLLCEYFVTDRLVFCLSLKEVDILKALYAQEETALSNVHVLEVESNISDDYLRRQAHEVGLGEAQKGETRANSLVIGALYNSILAQAKTLREQSFYSYHILRECASHRHNSKALAKFLDISVLTASAMLKDPFLFDDQ